MSRPKVEKVESSIKGGVVAQLGAKTLILGDNGVGKSAIVNAVELAGTGRASDVAGRATLAKDADLFMLAPPGADRVWSEVRVNQGIGAASWSLEKGHRAQRTGPEIAFPLRDVQEALLGSPETARKWILRHGGGFTWKDVLSLVPESLRKFLAADSPADPAEALTGALEDAKRRVRDLTASAKVARKFTPPAAPPPTAADFTALEAVIGIWKERGTAAVAGSPLAAIQGALDAAKADLTRAGAQALDVESTLAELPPPASGLELRRAAVLIAETLARAQARECAICGGKADPVELAARAVRGRASIDRVNEIERKRENLQRAQQESLVILSSLRREVERLTTEVARLERSAKATGPAPDMTLAEAETQLRALHTLRASWEAARNAEELALQAERDATDWTQLAEALSKALGQLVEKSRAAFCGRVQKFLPKSDLFGIDLLDGDREVLRVGLLRLSGDHMVLHAALSGAEWARVTAALALATAPQTGPCIVCPEERAFDPSTLALVLQAFDEAVAGNDDAPQIIVTSPTPPTTVATSWTVIQLRAPEKAPEPPKPRVKRAPRTAEPTPEPTERGATAKFVPDGKGGLVEVPIDAKPKSIFD